MLQRECRVQPPFGLKVCLMRIFGGFKVPKKVGVALVSYLRDKLSSSRGYPHNSGSVIPPRPLGVADVFTVTDSAQIHNAVIVSDAVDVVNEFWRELAVNVQPCKAVGLVRTAIDVDVDVPSLVFVSCGTSSQGHSTANAPSEFSGIGAVVQKLFQSSLRESSLSISHIVAPVQRWFGQRLGGIDGAVGPRFIIQEAQ